MVLPVKKQDFKITTSFLDPDYPEIRRKMGLTPAEHPGIDISPRSGDADLNMPVYAIYKGIVEYVGFRTVWGNIVLIRHKTLNIYTQYAHLNNCSVVKNETIEEGHIIGGIGKGDPSYSMLAHLHFEVRLVGPQTLKASYWPGMDRAKIKQFYMDPIALFSKFGLVEG